MSDLDVTLFMHLCVNMSYMNVVYIIYIYIHMFTA